MENKLDFTRTWNDVVALLKEHQSLVLPIAGVFIILPLIILGVLLPTPEIDPTQNPDNMVGVMTAYLSAMVPGLVVVSLVSMIGNLAIYHLVLGGTRPTVGEALSLALASFLPFFLASIISGIATFVGMIFLIIPGIYLAVKFSMTGPVIVDEGIKNPIDALSRSWNLTKGNSLRIFGFFLIVGIVAYVAFIIVNMILGGILGFISIAFATIVSSFLQGILSVFFLFVVMAVYRQLKNPSNA